jgi:L-fuconolactonase
MEVDVAEDNLDLEAEALRRLCASGSSQTFAAILGGRPASDRFEEYLKRHSEGGFLKGLRRVLHNPETPRGLCLERDFVHGIRALGKHGLTFDLCMRAGELSDAASLAAECPDTTLILDHCGNVDAKAFMKSPPSAPSHRAEDWQRAIERLALKRNVHCKISGVIESMPPGWTAEQIAPAVNHCLDAFGPDRVVFGSNWPVCLLGGPLKSWVKALGEIVSVRPQAERAKLWAENAKRIYRLV